MSTPAGPGKGKKKRRSKGRGNAGRGRGRGQDLPTPGRHESAGKPFDEEEVEAESEEKPATGASSVPEPSSYTTTEYDELPETERERPRETETIANEKVGEGGCVVPTKAKTSSSSTTVDEQQKPGSSAPRAKNKSKGKQQQVPGPSNLSPSSPSSGTEVKEPPSVAAANTTASTVHSTVTVAASTGAAEATPCSVPPAATSAGVKSASVPTTTAADKQDVEKSTKKLDYSFTINAHQTQGIGGPRPPKRPGYGTAGRPIRLMANFFRLDISSQLCDLYHYDVEITPVKCSQTVKRDVPRTVKRDVLDRTVKRDVVNQIIKKYKDTTFQGHHPAFDGKRNLYSRIKLQTPVTADEDGGKDYREFKAELSVKLPGEDGGNDREFKVKIKFAASVSLLELQNFLSGKQNGKVPQDAVQALDIVVREMPSLYYTPVGRSFFPFDGQGKPLGEGCEVQFGFYSSVRHCEWNTTLVNIDVSAKCFYKEQPVIDFLCDTLGRGETPQSLENRNFRFDRHRFEEAIRGACIQTTHAGYKRKYTVKGITSVPAEKLEFEVEDGATGRKSKTTVTEYFKNRYKLPLRYPHLPCLKCGAKKVHYLPMEVCTIIPCIKERLSPDQLANMIRSTARPAPERQQAIQDRAHELIQTSSKYLKEEFQTSISPEMVRVGGRVLPPPKIKLGPQDQAFAPRDGSWDMRSKMLHEGARISTWALACFDNRCSEDQLMNFCKQMASVSTREGMMMTEQPVAQAYARGVRDVESLFSKWVVDYPQLQLIMAVLPERDKDFYPEIKRVGDNVLGIATQCVQIRQAQQAKPQVCANLSLKINSKLGGINHVIDPSVKSPVFREPVIIFGADVTHPSPGENGIPSIAAVVASMDANATKYCARFRAQTHEKLRGAQEIINDLAAMVKELLVEFYRATGHKPRKIIFYRDGVSEGQFNQVLVYEVGAVQEACMKLEKEYRPKITFVVVQKRHHTRLFCEDKRDASGKAQNVPPGTTVDSGITHPYEFDFYLCSHYGIQGTSRPTHYHVLYDDNAFKADSLQQLTYQLCHVYARCTRSVSMPAPAYYAHLVAFRARHHVTNGRGGDTVDLERSTKAIQVNDKMKGTMYFT